MLEVVSRERPYPSAQRVGKKFLELLFKVAARAVVLKASRLINQRDDSNARKAANENFSSDRNVSLIRWELFLISGFQVNLADFRQQFCSVSACPDAINRAEKYRAALLDNVLRNIWIDRLTLQNSGEARILTDQASVYFSVKRYFAKHDVVNHEIGEYVSRADRAVHTNTIEGFFSIFKRGMKGVYQHCAHNHLHRYLAEFDFRYNNRVANGINDAQRADLLLKGVVGKRLTYETTAQ